MGWEEGGGRRKEKKNRLLFSGVKFENAKERVGMVAVVSCHLVYPCERVLERCCTVSRWYWYSLYIQRDYSRTLRYPMYHRANNTKERDGERERKNG